MSIESSAPMQLSEAIKAYQSANEIGESLKADSSLTGRILTFIAHPLSCGSKLNPDTLAKANMLIKSRSTDGNRGGGSVGTASKPSYEDIKVKIESIKQEASKELGSELRTAIGSKDDTQVKELLQVGGIDLDSKDYEDPSSLMEKDEGGKSHQKTNAKSLLELIVDSKSDISFIKIPLVV